LYYLCLGYRGIELAQHPDIFKEKEEDSLEDASRNFKKK